jgi:hypothetical protein
MKRLNAAFERLGEVCVADLIAWLSGLEQVWIKGADRPLVLVDPLFLQGRTARTVHSLMQWFPECRAGEHQISILNPGDYVPYHTDDCADGWISRIHAPILTNPDCWFLTDGLAHHMEVGMSYQVNPGRPHAVANFGDSVRVHLMFDVVR